MLHSSTIKLVKCWPSRITFDKFNRILWLNAFSRKNAHRKQIHRINGVRFEKDHCVHLLYGSIAQQRWSVWRSAWPPPLTVSVCPECSHTALLRSRTPSPSRSSLCSQTLTTQYISLTERSLWIHTHWWCETVDVIYPHTDGWYVGAQERRWSRFLSGCELYPGHPSISPFWWI